MRLHAVERGAAIGAAVDADLAARCRDEVAIEHGAADWEDLMEVVEEGRLWGTIPLEWIEASCTTLARARAGLRARR
jgi:hypothetical protein